MGRTLLATAGAATLTCAVLVPAGVMSMGSHGRHQAGAPAAAAAVRATAVVRGVEGDRLGRVWLRQTSAGVKVTARLRGLAEGFHGFHVHAVGSCEGQDPMGPFASAGGHYPGSTGGGHPEHAGDMPSLLAGPDGRAWASFVTERFSLAELVDADGSAVMVHAGEDNFANIPKDRYRSRTGVGVPDPETKKGGDSGDRLGCGVIASAEG